jgi:putative cardiolipin synthase
MLVLAGCGSLPENSDRMPSSYLTDTEDTALGRVAARYAQQHPGQSGFLLLGDGLDALVARAALAQAAERSIDAQYYLLHDDFTGRLFIDQLLRAADRGVRVRLLVDDMDLAGRDDHASLLHAHPNVQVRLFNPFIRGSARLPQFLTRFGSVTRRMHNKSFTADAQATILGGRNIGDEYFEANPDLAFGDLDVLAIGPVAAEVSASFDRYWNHALAYPIDRLSEARPNADDLARARARHEAWVADHAESDYLRALTESELARSLSAGRLDLAWGEARVFADDPDKLLSARDATELHMTPALGRHIGGVDRELIIFSPYFVPGRDGVQALIRLAERGVRVRVFTNSLASTDVPIVHSGYARYRKALLRGGVELYEASRELDEARRERSTLFGGSAQASLHAKSFVVDRERVFVGSLNLDPRSVVENTEIGVLFDSPRTATQMAEWFDAHIGRVAFAVRLESDEEGDERLVWIGREDGEERRYAVEPHTSLLQRITVNLMRLLPVESQL